MNAVPLAVFWMLLAYAMAARPAVIWFLFFGVMPFGALAAVPSQLTGGVTLLPQAIVAVFLVAKVILRPVAARQALDAAIDPRRFGLLVAFVAYSVASALIMPRLFAGQLTIVPVRADGAATELLWPSSSNFTQAAYLTLSLGVAIATAVYLRRIDRLAVVVRALCFGGLVLCITGLVDMAASAAGLSALLAPFRTASYAIFADSAIHGMHRAIGLMPEASTFGPLCVKFAAILYFLRSTSDARLAHPTLQAWVVVLLLAMAALSTSTTAYLGLFVLMTLMACNWLRRALPGDATPGERRRLAGEMAAAYVGVVVLAAIFVFKPETLAVVTDFVDRMVFQKAETSSFDERMLWNGIGMDVFAQTYGLGVGIGGTRTSSWAIAVLSNAGLIGTGLMVAFLVVCMVKPVPRRERIRPEAALGTRLAILVSLSMSSMAGTTTDFGVFTGAMFGIVMAVSWQQRRPATAPAVAACPPGAPGYRQANLGVRH